jgi:uncharacterized protein (DUF697 family)
MSYETGADFEYGEFGAPGEFAGSHEAEEQFLGGILGSILGGEVGSPLGEAEETQLASELLEIDNEDELEQFLGGLFKKAAGAVRGFVRSPVGRALGGVLKGVAKKALPVVGGALGSMVAPGVGTAIGTKLGSLASGLLEMEFEGMPQEQAEYEVARRVVGLSAAAARNAALSRPRPGVSPATVARAAVARAARVYAPGLYRSMMQSLKAGARPVGAPGRSRPSPFPRPGRRPLPAPGAAPAGVAMAVGGGYPESYPGASSADDGYPPDDAADDVEAPPGGAPSGRWIRRGRKIIVLGV